MKAEKVYAAISWFVSGMSGEEKAFWDMMEKFPDSRAYSTLAPLHDLYMDAQKEMSEDAARSSGRATPYKAAMRVIKKAKSVNLDRPEMHGAWIGKDGRQYVATGYHGIAFNEPMDLPKVAGVECIEKTISGSSDSVQMPLALPNAAVIQQIISEQKAEHKGDRRWDHRIRLDLADYNDGDQNCPVVNAEYLLDIVQALPGCEASYAGRSSSVINFKAESGAAVLCPVRRS